MLELNRIELAIARKFGIRENIIVPNVSWGFNCHECDLFIIKKSGYAIEVEIKRSISDLKADFKKGHNHKDSRIKELYYAIPEDIYDKCVDLIPIDAGIIVVVENSYGFHATIKREAKVQINNRKLTIEEQLCIARLGTMRIWSLKNNIININSNYKRIKRLKRIENHKAQYKIEFKN